MRLALATAARKHLWPGMAPAACLPLAIAPPTNRWTSARMLEDSLSFDTAMVSSPLAGRCMQTISCAGSGFALPRVLRMQPGEVKRDEMVMNCCYLVSFLWSEIVWILRSVPLLLFVGSPVPRQQQMAPQQAVSNAPCRLTHRDQQRQPPQDSFKHWHGLLSQLAAGTCLFGREREINAWVPCSAEEATLSRGQRGTVKALHMLIKVLSCRKCGECCIQSFQCMLQEEGNQPSTS